MSAMNLKREDAKIADSDMTRKMQMDAIDMALYAYKKYGVEKDIAAHLKKEFDSKYQSKWHVIVGKNFGSYVSHEKTCFIYFFLGQVGILLFKSGC